MYTARVSPKKYSFLLLNVRCQTVRFIEAIQYNNFLNVSMYDNARLTTKELISKGTWDTLYSSITHKKLSKNTRNTYSSVASK